MTKCGNSLTLLGDFVVDRVNHRGELCAQDCYKGSSEWRTLCSWPRREKVLLVNNVPVVYFGRTNDNKPIYWSPAAEVDASDQEMGDISWTKTYSWITTGATEHVTGEPYTLYTFYFRAAGGGLYTFLWGVPYYVSVGDGKLEKRYDLPAYQTAENFDHMEKVKVYPPEPGPQWSGFTSTDEIHANGKKCAFSIWRDDGGYPLTLSLQPRVVPPEHKSEYRALLNDRLHYGMTSDGDTLSDFVWGTFSGRGRMTRVNGTYLDYENDANCKVVDFSVSVNADGLEVKAEIHVESNKRKVFDYLDVVEQEVVSGITCEVKDCEED